MALVLADRVLETTAVAGTGDAALTGAVLGYQPFSTIGGGNTTYYTIVAIDDQGAPTGDWEVGIGTYITAGNKVSRDTVLSSSNGGAKVYFASGTKQIFLDLPSEEVLLSAGDVNGPASAVNSNFALFDGTTGKLLKDAGINASTFATAAQGAKADTAVQPGSLGSAAYLTAGAANGVATLDAGGKVPVSQIPALGDLNYQGTWNASTNTPTLVSSSGTKGYYYVVSVAGSTNLNGITDWAVGDWAVFNGSVWQKIDNTDAVTSVNGYTGTVVLTYSDVGAFPATATTGTGSVVLATNPTISSPNIDVIDFDQTYATPLTAGQLGWDGNNTLAIGMAGGNVTQHIGEDLYFYCKASSAITKGQVVMFTGAVGASGVPTGAPATGITDGTYIMGIAAESIALNGFGLVQAFGELRNVNTSTYADGDILWYNPAVTGGLTKTKPSAPNVKVQMAAVINGGSSGGGTILIRIDAGSTLGGTDSNAQITSPTNGQILTYDGASTYWKNTSLTAGTAISVSSASDGTLTITNSAPDQTVSITGAGGAVVTGTYPNFTITTPSGTVTSVTGTAPISSTGGATPAISISQATTSTNGYLSSTDWNTFNNKQPAGSYLTTVTATTPLSGSGTVGSPLVIAQATTSTSGYLSSTDWNTFNNKGSGTVTSVTGTAPVVSSGGTTPAISMAAANTSTNGYLTSTDWNTFNGKYSTGGALGTPSSGTLTNCTGLPVGGISATGTPSSTTYLRGDGTWSTPASVGVNSVTGTAPISVSTTLGVATVSISQATTSTNGYLSSTDWNTFNNKGSGTVTSITAGTYLTGGTITGSGTIAVDATNLNTASKVVARDASGNFSAGTITASLTGNASGSAATFTSTTQDSQFNSIGVGTAASTTAGQIRATGNITAFYSSDKTLKEEIKPIEQALNKVNAIGGVEFDWTDEYIKENGGEDGYFLRKHDFGVIAQDVQAVFPLAVREREDGKLAVDYEKLVALAFAAIKELKAEVDLLKGK